ncbi:MAG: lysophospholipid acyltransferase family protein [Phycisphaerales bacterium]|nr:lysophospholipid acyltransferase family protein [Phycisphaerales bacterium]
MEAQAAPRMHMAERLSVASLLNGYRFVPKFMHRIRPWMISMTWRSAKSWKSALRENGRIILGPEASPEEIDAYGRGVLLYMQRYMESLVIASRATEQDLLDRVDSYKGIEEYWDVRSRHRGAVLISMHMGEFEPAAALIRRFDAPIHILYRRDRISRLERIRASARERHGVKAHAVDDGLTTWGALRDALDRDEVVALHGDRVQPGQKGILVDLLGHKTELPVGPFKLAFSTGAPLFPVFNRYLSEDRLALEIGSPIELDQSVMRSPEKSSAVQSWSRMLGERIREAPEQWLNVYPVWRHEEASDEPRDKDR